MRILAGSVIGGGLALVGQTIRIEGRVVDVDTGAPIATAEVTLSSLGSEKLFRLTSQADSKTLSTKTDIEGRYSFEVPPGRYSVAAMAVGMKPAGPDHSGSPNPALLLDPPSSEAVGQEHKEFKDKGIYRYDLGLVGVASVSGEIVSREDGSPVPGARVLLLARTPMAGLYIASIQAEAITDARGHFAAQVRPGKYTLAIRSLERREEEGPKELEESGLPSLEYRLDYRDEELAAAPYISLESGQKVVLSPTRVSKVPVLKFTVQLDKSHCEPGELYTVRVARNRVGPTFSVVQDSKESRLACGDSLPLTGLAAGSYIVYVRGANGSSGKAVFDTDEGDGRTITISAVLPQTVRFSIVDAKQKLGYNPAPITIELFPTDPSGGYTSPGPVNITREGVATMPSVVPNEWTVWVAGLPEGLTVDSMKYNQVVVQNGKIVIDPLVTDHTVSIELASRARLLTGVVQTNDKAVSNATVVIVRMPFDQWSAHYSKQVTSTDESGRFTFSGQNLVPREYRVVAVPGSSASKLEFPGALEGVLQDSRSVEVRAGTVDLGIVKLIQP